MAVILAALVGLAACTGSTAGSASAAPAGTSPTVVLTTPAAGSGAGSSAEASGSPASLAPGSSAEVFTPVPTDIDPCTLLTADDVSSLAGSNLGPGRPSTLSNNTRVCLFGQNGNGLIIRIMVAPSADAARAAEPDFKAELEKAVSEGGIKDAKLTELPNFEPGVDAAILEGVGQSQQGKLAGITAWALKGAVIVSISQERLGDSAATNEAMQTVLKSVLDHLP